MRVPRSCGVAVLLALSGCFWKRNPGPAPLTQAEGPAMVRSRVAPKGAHLEVAVRAGSACDPVGQEGLAWLVAHGIAEGGTSKRSATEVAALLKSWEGVLTASVDPEIARFTLDVSPEHANDAADLLGELVTSPGFDPAVLARLQAADQARLHDGLPAEGVTLAGQLLVDWVFAGHPYGHPATGRWGVVTTLAPRDARRFFDERYVRSQLAGGAATEAPADPLAHLQKALGAAPPRLVWAVTPRPVAPVQGRTVMAVRGPAGGAWIAVGSRIPLASDDPDEPALAVAAEVLRARLAGSSPLWISVAPFPQPVQGALALTVQVPDPSQGRAALRTMLDALELLALQGVSQPELDAARDALLSARSSALGDPDLALASALRAAVMKDADPLDVLPDRLVSLDAASVNAAIGRQIHPQDLRIVAVVPDPDVFSRGLREETGASSVQGAAVAGGLGPQPPPSGGYVLGIGDVVITSAQDLLR